MYDGRRAGARRRRELGWLASIYFMTMVVIGAFIVMNLFLAILLSDPDPDEEEEEEDDDIAPSIRRKMVFHLEIRQQN